MTVHLESNIGGSGGRYPTPRKSARKWEEVPDLSIFGRKTCMIRYLNLVKRSTLWCRKQNEDCSVMRAMIERWLVYLEAIALICVKDFSLG